MIRGTGRLSENTQTSLSQFLLLLQHMKLSVQHFFISHLALQSETWKESDITGKQPLRYQVQVMSSASSRCKWQRIRYGLTQRRMFLL